MVHPYLKQALILHNQINTTCLELEKALQSIEGVEPSLPGIIVKQVFKIGSINTSAWHREKQGNNQRTNDENSKRGDQKRQQHNQHRNKKPGENSKCQYYAKTNHLAKDCYFCKDKDDTKGQKTASHQQTHKVKQLGNRR